MSKILFYIFQVGDTSRNQLLAQAFEDACSEELLEDYEIQVIDITKAPKAAEKYKILATPTICRMMPKPEKRLIGNLSVEQARTALLFLIDDLTNEYHVKVK